MRRTFSVAALMAIMASAVFFAAAPATAQTGYPPTCNAVNPVVDAGSHAIGETFQVVLLPICIFTPGASIAVTVNGVAVGTKVADANGAITVTVEVVSATEVLINDPVSVAIKCGTVNTVVADGASAVSETGTATKPGIFTVVCPTAAPATPQPGRVAFTGANIAKWAAVALALVGLGAVLVTLNRRRGHAGS